jgi:hypothetical protein
MSNLRPAPDHQPLPPPTNPTAREAWEAANLTSTEIRRRHDPRRFQAFRWRREAQHRRTLRYGLGSLVIPVVGPYAWHLANTELAAIRSGTVSPKRRHWLVLAKICAIISTLALAAGAVLGVVLSSC